MRARGWAVLLLLAPAVLAGCLGSGGGDGGEPASSTGPSSSSPTPSPTDSPLPQSLVVDLLPDFSFAPCRGISVQASRPEDQVQALLPEGFTAAPAFGSDGLAVVGLDLYACGNLTTPNAQIPDVVFGQVYTHILQPAERVPGAPEASVHEYTFRLLSRPDVLARLWPAAGYDTRNGTADVSIGVPGNAPVDLGLRVGNGSVGPEYSLLAEGSSPLVPVPASGTFARYTELADGSVLVWTGAYDLPSLTSGPGTFDVAGDDPLAGFEAADGIAGLARLYESGGMVEQDLRRFF